VLAAGALMWALAPVLDGGTAHNDGLGMGLVGLAPILFRIDMAFRMRDRRTCPALRNF
jgi:hypothetical protein